MAPRDITTFDDKELVDGLIQNSAKAGLSGSGLVIDVFAGMHREQLHIFKEEVLRRLGEREKKATPV